MQQRLPWQRRLFLLDEPPVQGRYGWPPARSAAGVLLADERGTSLIVLRGERGLGKTVALRQEYEALTTEGVPAVWLELKHCTTSHSAQTRLQQALTRPAGAGEWHVLLDGLDEGLNDLPQLDQLLHDILDTLPESAREALRLRITCRSARWPARLEDALRLSWAPDHIKIMGMAPLGRDDVALAAQAFEVTDTDTFLTAVQQQGLVALATHPVTLLQLLESYATHASLPKTAQEAYLQACLRLCTEHRRSTDPRQLQAEKSPEHLLAVAARLAAALQFGPYTAVADTPTEVSATTADLRLSRLDGGDEPGHLNSRVPCTLWDLRQVTESGLLAPVGDLRWVFAHDSYREFLAAHFLRMHALQPQPQRQLLWIGDGDARHIIPAHQEVAAWRATSDPTLFSDLLREDPLILLLADLPGMPAADRERTVDALFTRLEQDDTVRLDHSLLHRLDHPGLAAQLRLRLAADSEADLLWAAISIARACPKPELADDLLNIAENSSQDPDVRAVALTSLTTPASEEPLTRLTALAKDTSPEVVAAALRHLYPGQLTLTEFLDHFRDTALGFGGPATLLRREILEQIDAATVIEAVTWAQHVLQPGRTPSASHPLAIILLARAVTLNEDTPTTGLVPLVGEGILHLTGHDEDFLYDAPMQTALEDLSHALQACPRTRREIARHLFRHSTEEQFSIAVSAIPQGALLSYDVLYWMENWDELTRISPHLAPYAVRFAPPRDARDKIRAEAARQAHPTLAAATAFYWDTYPRQQRERAERVEATKRLRRFDAAGLSAALEGVLAARSTDVLLAAWGQVLQHLHRTPDGSPSHHNGSLLSYATHAPSLPPAGSDLSIHLARAAIHFLTQLPPLTAADLISDPDGDVRPAVVLTAFALVPNPVALRTAPERWAGWALALATTHVYGTDEHDTQHMWLPLSLERARDLLPPLLNETLEHASAQTLRDLADTLGRQPAYGLRPLLHAWAMRPERSPEQWYAVLDELVIEQDSDALTYLAEALDTDPRTREPDSPSRQRWLLAAVALLHRDTPSAHWPAVARGLSDPAVLQEYRRRLTQLSTGPDAWPFTRLDDDALAELYTLLLDDASLTRLQQSPHLNIQDDDRLVDLLQHLPRILAIRATPQAAAALHRLAQAHPAVPQLRMLAHATARAAADHSATPLEPEQLIRLATDKQTRLVRDARQLLDLIRESLTAMEEDLQGYNGTAVNLWNRDRDRFEAGTRCWPCWEDDLSDAVASFLRRDIGGHRVVVNREVQVRRNGLPGLRTDLQIEAPPPNGASQHTIRVVIEAKGCWNKDLPTTAQTQLRAYLSEPHTAGLLLVGYFDSTRWNTKKRGCPRTNHSIDDIRREQLEQVRTFTQDEPLLAAAHVLDCRLPSEDSDWRKTADPA